MNTGREMDTVSAARSRHTTAFLEEALGNRASPDLSARVAARLAAAPMRSGRRAWLAAALVLGGIGVVAATAYLRREDHANSGAVAATQDPVRAAESLSLRVRNGEGGAVEWLVGERRASTGKELADALRDALAAAKARALELVITPEPGCEWRHVATTTDAGHAAGFTSIRYAGAGAPSIVPKQLPAEESAELAVAQFSEPDEAPSPDRPTLELQASGRIMLGNDVLFTPTRRDGDRGDTTQLRARLLQLRVKLLPAGKRELQSGKKVLTTPLMLKVHRDTEWHFVALVLRLATDPAIAFGKVEFAVAGAR